MTVSQFFNKILDILFPTTCGICNKISKQNICEQCKNQIQIHKKIQKVTKFKHLKNKLNTEIYFDEQIYFYEYQGIIRKKIIEYKFKDKPYLYRMFAEIITDKKLVQFCKNYNIIIPVPISKKRMAERGYNQAELISKQIVKQLGNLQILTNILYKIKNVKPQSSMETKQERIKNIKGVYQIQNAKLIRQKNVILFDDIFTTGSTANECAKMLKQAGANKVGIITIAKD